MAYTTGTTASMKSLLDAIETFLTGNGWTLHDGLSILDRVFKSLGTGGKQNHYVRIRYAARTVRFNTQTANFTPGATLTGQTSGATAKVLSQTDSGTYGTLLVYDVDETIGRLRIGETITDSGGGSAKCGDGAGTLPYDAQSVNFTVGETVTGGTSGATGVVTNDVDAGGTGTLTLKTVVGTFVDNEQLSGSTGGSNMALVNGSLTVFAGAHLGAIEFDSRRHDPANVENACDFLEVLGYNFWDAGAHTGTGEFAQVGPWQFTSAGNAGSPVSQISRVDNLVGIQSSFLVTTPRIVPGVSAQNGNFTQQLFHPGKLHAFDGIRRLMSVHGGYGTPWASGNGPVYDVAANIVGRPHPEPATVDSDTISYCPVWDKANDRLNVYTMNPSADQNFTFERWDIDSNAWTFKQNPTSPVLALQDATPNHVRMCFDGHRFLYVINGQSSSVKFGRYDTFTNTWESLADLPGAGSSHNAAGSNPFIYLPRSLTGAAEDWILFARGASTGTIWVYRVGANVWFTSGLDLNSAPSIADSASSCMWWDGTRYLWWARNNATTTAYRIDLSNVAIANSVWSSALTIHYTARSGGAQWTSHIDPLVCKVKGKQGATMTYHLVGDADTVTISTRLAIGDSYWCQFGMANTQDNTFIATVAGSSTGTGAAQVVQVDASTGFSVGERILFMDITTGLIEATVVAAKTDATHITVRLANSFPVGARAFVDGIHCLLTGDSGWAIYGHDAGGFNYNNQTTAYRAVPISESWISDAGSDDGRGRFKPDAFLVYDDMVTADGTKMKSFGKRASLRHVFALKNAAYPSPTDQDTINDLVSGSSYKVISTKHTRRLPDDRIACIGPIN